jgi:hypothetical protein
MAEFSPLRVLAKVLGIIVMLFSGGCGALFLVGADGTYVSWPVVLLFTAPPLLIGWLIYWLATRERPT